MAQRTEKEETEFTVPTEKLTLCGSNSSSNTTTTATAASAASSIATMTLRCSSPDPSSCSAEQDVQLPSPECLSAPVTESTVAKRAVNRCFGCRKKVGLIGFRCRCGELFCGEHRYSDRHNCSYDYKAAGREAIAKENPVLKVAKIVRI